MESVTAVDLFAGCGGTSCGLMQAGIDVVAMVEKNPWAAITYMSNLCRHGEFKIHFLTPEDEAAMDKAAGRLIKDDPKCRAGHGWISSQPSLRGCRHVIIGDIRLVSGRELLQCLGMERGELGLMTMSPPCQGFSTANTRRDRTYKNDPRNDLCFEAARLIIECQPKSICLENVPDFRKSEQFAMFQALLKGGAEAVRTFEKLLPAHPHWACLLSDEPAEPKLIPA